MSWGGAVQAMVTSLKNNARPKRKNYFDGKGMNSEKQSEKHPWTRKKATQEQLENIRRKVAAQKRSQLIRNVKIMILTLSIIAAILTIVNYLYGNEIKEFLLK